MKTQATRLASNRQRLTRRQFLSGVIGASTLAALAACATPAAPVDTTGATSGEGAAPAAEGATRTIEMWMWETEPRWRQVEDLSGLNEEFPDVEFRWTALPSDQLHQKALTSMAAGIPEGLPSIIRTSMTFYRTFVNANGVLDMTEHVAPYEEDVLPSVWQGAQIDGKFYQVPDDTGVMLFGYRTDLFEQAGLPTDPNEVADLLATWDELIAVGETLDGSVGAKLFNLLPNQGVFNNIALQDSTGYFDADGNVIFDSTYHVEVANLIKRLWDSGLTTNYEQGPQQWQAYKDGQLATMFYPNWQDFVVIDSAPETVGKWKVTKLPAVEAGGRRATSADGVCLCIPTVLDDDQKQLATDVALYMKMTEKATVAHMETFSGAFVSYIPGLEAMADFPSPVLDNQFVYQLHLNAAVEEEILPWYRTSVFFPDAQQAVSDAMFRILNEEVAADVALSEAAESIRGMQQNRGVQ